MPLGLNESKTQSANIPTRHKNRKLNELSDKMASIWQATIADMFLKHTLSNKADSPDVEPESSLNKYYMMIMLA